jgi:hypothetical protein
VSTVTLSLLIATVALALIMAAAIWGSGRAADRLVGDKHRALESITATGDVPEKWRRGFERKISRLVRRGAAGAKVAAVQMRAKQNYVQRLDKLVNYVRASTLVADEETRQVLLDRISDVRALWESTPPDHL